MKKLIFLIVAVCTVCAAGCQKDDNEDVAVVLGTTVPVSVQATRAAFETSDVSVRSGVKTAGIRSAGLYYRKSGDTEWQSAVGVLNADGTGFTTQLVLLSEQTDYEYRAWIECASGTVADNTVGMFSTCRYYDILYTCDIAVNGISATLNFSGVEFRENGIPAAMENYRFGYRRSGDEALVESVITPVGRAFTIVLPDTGVLEEQMTYEYCLSCDYYGKTVSDAYGNMFKTVNAAVDVEVFASTVVGTSEGVTCAAEVRMTLDGNYEAAFDTCAVDYREKGTSSWTNAIGKRLGDAVCGATIPVAGLTAGKSYEYRFCVGHGSVTWVDPDVREFRYAAQEIASVAGEWKLRSFNGSSDLPYIIYLRITAANGFELYQHFTSPGYDAFSGAISLMDGCLSGIYDDGVLWGTTYDLQLSGDTMIWTDRQDAGDVSVYERCDIPAEVNATRAVPGDTPSGRIRFL